MLSLYIHRDSFVHRLTAGRKLLMLFAGGAAIAFMPSLTALAVFFGAILALYGLARLPFVEIFKAMRPILLIAAVIFALQWALTGPMEAARTILRIGSLVLLASLVTLTTPQSAMIETLSRLARPLAPLGLSPSQLALAISLTLRFIPVLMNDYREIESARAARSAKYPALGAAGPLLIKTLHMTGALSDAIAARGFETRDEVDDDHAASHTR